MVLPSNSHSTWPPEIWNHNSDYGSVNFFIIVPLQNVTPAHSVQSPSQTTHTNFSLHVSQFSLYAPVTLNCLMFFPNVISSLCTFIRATLSSYNVPATCLPGICLLILNYLAKTSAL